MPDDLDTSDRSGMARVNLAAALHTHLATTEELPIDPTANRWLGEAQATAADVADGSAPEPSSRGVPGRSCVCWRALATSTTTRLFAAWTPR